MVILRALEFGSTAPDGTGGKPVRHGAKICATLLCV
jgi:hypothetical protein